MIKKEKIRFNELQTAFTELQKSSCEKIKALTKEIYQEHYKKCYFLSFFFLYE